MPVAHPEPLPVIVVDAMGGDFAPANVVEGAIAALRERGNRFSVVLVGQRDRIDAEVKRVGSHPACTTVHASEVIDMHDSPTTALKAKRDSSIRVGLELHRSGQAHGFVSAGNTGAVFSAATLLLGRIEGVGRPTIGALIPTARQASFLLDAGANVDCRPDHLFEFGVMGSVYMASMMGRRHPTVALLNIGEEEAKGNQAVQEAFTRLRSSKVNFVGNIEGRDVLAGKADVIVCDGFVGNILLKFGESVPSFLKARFSAAAKRSPIMAAVGLLSRSSLRSVMKELDYQEHGGVPVLGVNGVAIIGHGGSTPKAIKNMIFRAEEMIARRLTSQIEERLHEQHG